MRRLLLLASTLAAAVCAAAPAPPAGFAAVPDGVPALRPGAWAPLHPELPIDQSTYTKSISPDSRWVVFTGDLLTDDVDELFAAPVGGGSTPIRLNADLPKGSVIRDFEISPDSGRVVYSVGEVVKEAGANGLFSVPITGGESVPLSGGRLPNIVDFEIAAGSTRVVFTAGEKRLRLYSATLDGSDVDEINHPLADVDTVYRFLLAPDGSRAVYVSYDDNPSFSLHSVAIDGSGYVRLTPDPKAEVGRFMISPDSKRVVFVEAGGDRFDLESIAITGGQSVVVNPDLTTANAVDEWEIAPDSRRVAFLARTPVQEGYGLYSSPIASADPVPVTGPTDVRLFRFTPDSSRIVYWGATKVEGPPELRAVPALGGTSLPLNVPPVTGGSVDPEFEISADSQRVVYTGDLLVDEVRELFSAPLDGGFPTRLNGPLSKGSTVGYDITVLPDGSHAVYSITGPKASGSQAFVVGVAGGTSLPVDGALPDRTVVGRLAASADSRWVVFERIQVDDKQRQLSSFAMVPAGASVYMPLSPARVFDTRPGTAAPGTKGLVASGSSIDVQITGRAGIPAGAVAVALNVTATESAGPGFVTVWPAGRPRPVASSLNLTGPGQTRPNMVVVPIGSDGRVSLYAQVATHLLADVIGYFVPADGAVAAGRIQPLEPTRVFDTRSGEPAPGPKGFVGAGETIEPVVAGTAGVPSDAAAVVLNITATDAAGAGFVTVWPSGSAQPVASTLNLAGPGDTAPNLVIVPVGSDGRISIFSQSGAHLLADVTGYVTGAGARNDISGLFVPLDPNRVFDTRPGETAPGPKGFVGPGSTVVTQISGRSGVPDRVGLVALNVTATDAATGFVSAFPGTVRPLASTTNLVGPNDTRASAALTPVGPTGALRLFSQSGAHLVADVAGYTLA